MILQADDELEAVSTARLLTIMCNDIRLAFITDEIKAQSYENFLCILRDSIQVRQEVSMKCVCGFSEEKNEGDECVKYATEPLKCRIKALEKALKEYAACETCAGKSGCEENGKAVACILVVFDPDAWEFDLARFVETEVQK